MTSEPVPEPPPPSRLRWLVTQVRGLVGTLVVLTVALAVVGMLRAPKLNELPPPLSLTNLAGQPVALADFAGKTVLVNFWATWCGPCRLELPMLRGHDSAATPVLFVSVDGTRPALTKFAKDEGLPLERVLMADAATQRAWGVSTLPTTVVIGPDGHVRTAHTGLVSPAQLWWWGR